MQQGIEPAIADVFDADAVKAVVSRAQPEVVIEQLTALPRTYTPESMNAAAALNHRATGTCPAVSGAGLAPQAVRTDGIPMATSRSPAAEFLRNNRDLRMPPVAQ